MSQKFCNTLHNLAIFAWPLLVNLVFKPLNFIAKFYFFSFILDTGTVVCARKFNMRHLPIKVLLVCLFLKQGASLRCYECEDTAARPNSDCKYLKQSLSKVNLNVSIIECASNENYCQVFNRTGGLGASALFSGYYGFSRRCSSNADGKGCAKGAFHTTCNSFCTRDLCNTGDGLGSDACLPRVSLLFLTPMTLIALLLSLKIV
ncbi:uncharacterized protein LOC143461730 [Clavelina lepadiformis]|uniref:Uncharacterized protein n=1 Tax=Clavelina lepadiformis TaxID=159417 RepID=A0ABP0GMT8_CLALP